MTGTVWVAEKPSAAADLVAGLCLAFGLKAQRAEGFFELSNGDVVLPLEGHLLETVRPAEYLDEKSAEIERSYRFDEYKSFLPILPQRLKKIPRSAASSKPGGKGSKSQAKSSKSSTGVHRQYRVAQKLLKGAKKIVNAGDIDREGQLIVDELLEHLGIDPYSPHVLRFGVASNLAEDIARAAKGSLTPNGDQRWRRSSEAALTRQYLDWVWGINFSMVGQARYKNARIAAGRVQTPVLSLVDERCRLIENFKPSDYFVPVITLADGTVMRWKSRPGSQGQAGFDSEGRIVSEALAQSIVERIKRGLPGEITKAEVKQHAQKPPLGYSLSSLQAAASRELGMTLEQVEQAAKSLYQTHKAISYIGTDCKFLPESMHEEAPRILSALADVASKAVMGADTRIKSAIFNDAKLDEHYAIVPTGKIPRGLSEDEQGVFMMVTRRFIAQFYPDYIYRRHKIEAKFGEDEFSASARQDVRLGWREVDGKSVPTPEDKESGQSDVDAHDESSERQESPSRPLDR